MFCKLNSYCLNGIDALPIDVEVDLQQGLPGFDIVGLPDSSVKEAKERVKSAIKNSGLHFPICHITINLAPADIKKEGCLYDLPIALGILCCLGEIPLSALTHRVFIGELALDGAIRGVRGLLPILCDMSGSALQCIIPKSNESEASLIHHLDLCLATHLKEAIAFLKDEAPLERCTTVMPSSTCTTFLDYADVRGQDAAKRGLLLCAAGYHNTLLIGPPGSGKTMLAQRLPSILPPLSQKECIEITKIYSVANQLPDNQIVTNRPFRSPHHTISNYGLTGGGLHPKPGEISLAHLGVLFLDELLEFNKHLLDMLRQPLESHTITLSRAQTSLTYPANFIFLSATNPCPCGYFPDTSKCTCSLQSVKKYLAKLSAPLIDRVDIHLETHVPTLKELQSPRTYSSKDMSTLIIKAHQKQAQRFEGTSIEYNSQIPTQSIPTYCKLTPAAQVLLNQWFESSSVSIRAYDKILRLALTIADVDDCDVIDTSQITEAIHYRLLDRQFWA